LSAVWGGEGLGTVELSDARGFPGRAANQRLLFGKAPRDGERLTLSALPGSAAHNPLCPLFHPS